MLKFSHFVLDPRDERLWKNGTEVPLRPRDPAPTGSGWDCAPRVCCRAGPVATPHSEERATIH
jgi:hypothetical protein